MPASHSIRPAIPLCPPHPALAQRSYQEMIRGPPFSIHIRGAADPVAE